MSVVVLTNHSTVGAFAPAADVYDWRADARCKGVSLDVFFPQTHNGRAGYDAARVYCTSCPVRIDCLDDALQFGDHEGFRGGMTPRQRGKVRSRRRDIPRVCRLCRSEFSAPFTVVYCGDDCRNAARRLSVTKSRAKRSAERRASA